MPTPPRPTPRGVLRWTVAVALLVGLFAMHGLPMDRPGPMTGHAMATSGAASPASHPAADASHPAHPAPRVAEPTAAPDLLPTDAGCTATDHCTAILRAAGLLAIPAPMGGPATPADPGSAASALRPADRAARAPPDLTALGISRT